MSKLSPAVAAALAFAACTPVDHGGAGEIDQRVAVPAAPDGGLQFVMPDTVVKAGDDVILCFIPDSALTADFLAKSFESVHAGIAVHVDVMLSIIPRTPQIFDCTDPQLTATLTPLFLPGLALPDAHAVRLPAATPLVIRTHYKNDTGHDVRVADVTRFFAADAGAVETSVFVVTSTNVLLHAGPASFDVDCTAAQDVQLLSLAAHMNSLGKSVHMTHGADDLYDIAAWTPAMMDEPPTTTFDTPLAVTTGDALRLSCTWDNTLGRDVFFPEELCASFSYATPASAAHNGLILCGDAPGGEGEGEGAAGEGEGEGAAGEGEGEGAFVPDPACPDVPAPNNACLPHCGNEIFVGQPCTAGGGECSDHSFGQAIFCSADFDASAALAMCTKPCVSDSQCGSDAVCIGDPGDPNSSKGCVPTACSQP